MIYLLYVLAYLVGSGLVMCIGASIFTDKQLKIEMLNEQKKAEAARVKKAEDEAWVNQIINNILNQSDELAY